MRSGSRSKTMEREDDTIELGAASVETKGHFAGNGDMIQGQQGPGLSDD
jgi:hypothetical protein